MKKLLVVYLFLIHYNAFSQNYYFPPITGSNVWETIDPTVLGWRTDKLPELYDFLEQKNSKAFILLKDGKIVVEKYFGTFTADSLWYWASAGKTLTAMLTGIAQEEGLLSLSDKSSKHQGKDWTSCSPEQEDKITVWHQLTMTTGLDDTVGDPYCTLPSCLKCLADPGNRWSYHNAPYTLLDEVIQGASGQNYNTYFASKIRNKIGMNGAWFKVGFNNIYFSNPRSMARYGLLVLNRGKWGSTQVLKDTAYFHQMVNTSQGLNLSYGYLWWLNGKKSFMVPGSQIVFPRMLMPNAPEEMIAALGKNGQIINVVPSQGLVLVRMGDAPADFGEVTPVFNDDIWKILSSVIEVATNNLVVQSPGFKVEVYPNPISRGNCTLQYELDKPAEIQITIYSSNGVKMTNFSSKQAGAGLYQEKIDMGMWSSGVYLLKIQTADGYILKKIVIEN